MRREYVWTHDIAGDQNGVIGHGLLDLWIDERLDQSEQLGLEIAADNPKASLLADDLELVHAGRRFFVTELEDSRRGTLTTIRVEADALWYRLGEIVYVGSLILADVTPAAGLATILDGTGWTVGTATTATADTFSLEQQDKSRLQLLRTWAKITGRALVFNTFERTVDLADERGAELGLAFRYGRNLLGVRRRKRPPELTVLYPFGADDLTIAGVNGGVPYVEDFTYYTDQGLDLETARELYTRSRVWADAAFVRDVDLLPAAEARLATQSQPATSYELDVVDLSEMIAINETVRVADRVNVYDPSFDADLRTFVTRTRRHPLTPWKNKIELSTILNPIADPGSATSRSSRSAEWIQFVGPVAAAYVIRNDGDYITNRIALAFRDGGRANFHLDLFATGVGAGTMHVSVLDFENGEEVQRRQLDIPYTNGALARASLDWAREELEGNYDFRVRVTTTASGGPSTTNGVNIAADANDEASFYIMAQGAVQETPTAPNTVRFDYTGADQSWTVPDGVHEARVKVAAASGAGTSGGAGGIVTATFPLVPGTVYLVEVGGRNPTGRIGFYPEGGNGGENLSATIGGAGGGRSAMRPTGSSFPSSLIVAGGGGGRNSAALGTPGGGGFFAGVDSVATAYGNKATGGTQFAGGIGSNSINPDGITSRPGAQGQGANCDGGLGGFQAPGGGGGDGWYGGGSGDPVYNGNTLGGPCGAGGSGWIDPASGYFDLFLEDASNPNDDGYVEITWENPA